ncbi:MAG TPA: hypothetical protein ENG03_05625 [Thioploca sp.]|nr:MAG: hypothetical protein DRR19_15695 [Gammaproteobacteria bacterium]HDN26564.1 hypothetical protein [Thioploca sp.]
MFTQYEDFKENPDAFFASIWAFYDLDKSFTYKVKTLRVGERHFRKGMVDEWRQVFSPEQAVKASQMIPERLFKKFKWSP